MIYSPYALASLDIPQAAGHCKPKGTQHAGWSDRSPRRTLTIRRSEEALHVQLQTRHLTEPETVGFKHAPESQSTEAQAIVIEEVDGWCSVGKSPQKSMSCALSAVRPGGAKS